MDIPVDLTLNLRCGSSRSAVRNLPGLRLEESFFPNPESEVLTLVNQTTEIWIGGWGLQDPTQEANLKVSFKMAENLGCDYPLWD